MEHTVRSKILRSDILAMRAKSYNDIHNIFTVPCKKSEMSFFASSVMKNVVGTPARSRFQVKLICFIAFGPSYHLIIIFEIGISSAQF